MKTHTLRKNPTGNTHRICEQAKLFGYRAKPFASSHEVDGSEGTILHIESQNARMRSVLRGPMVEPRSNVGRKPITEMEQENERMRLRLAELESL
jgi:hypothetical protein